MPTLDNIHVHMKCIEMNFIIIIKVMICQYIKILIIKTRIFWIGKDPMLNVPRDKTLSMLWFRPCLLLLLLLFNEYTLRVYSPNVLLKYKQQQNCTIKRKANGIDIKRTSSIWKKVIHKASSNYLLQPVVSYIEFNSFGSVSSPSKRFRLHYVWVCSTCHEYMG